MTSPFFFSSIWGFFRAGKQDLIIVELPPILAALVSVFFSWLWRAKLCLHVQDLQLDAAVSLGMVKRGFLTGVLTKIELLQFQAASVIVTITDGMKSRIVAKGVPAEKVETVHNWTIPVHGPTCDGSWFQKNRSQFSDCFNVVYSGNLGVKQGLDSLIEIAAQLTTSPHIRFYIFGQGADRQRLEQKATSLNLSSLEFGDFLERDEYFQMIHSCDVAYISQLPSAGDVFFPSKLMDILQAQKPIIGTADADSELSRFVTKAQVGVIRPHHDSAKLAADIRMLADHPDQLEAMVANTSHAAAHFDRTKLLAQFEQILVGSKRDNTIQTETQELQDSMAG